MKIKLSDIGPNPYRDLIRNPLVPAKVEELRGSIRDTGYWDNCVVRKHPTAKGKYELAYGHHRYAAAIAEGLTEADFIVKALPDAMMLKIMARENSEVYKYSILSLLESVRGVVNALAEGQIPAFEIGSDTRSDFIRTAPSFVPGIGGEKFAPRSYTTYSVAEFLGYTKKKGEDKYQADENITAALNVLELIELKQMTEAGIANLSVDKLLTMTRDIKARLAVTKVKMTEDVKRAVEADKAQQKFIEERREQAKKDAEAQAELVRKEFEANKEKDAQRAKEIRERREHLEAEQLERELNNKEVMAELEERVNTTKAAVASKKDSKNTAVIGEYNDLMFQLGARMSDSDSLLTRLKKLANKADLTLHQRNDLWKAMQHAGNRYLEGSNTYLLPPDSTDVLAEARSKEEARWEAKEEPCETV